MQKMIIVTLLVLGSSTSAFASDACNPKIVQAQLDNEIIGKALNDLHIIKVRAEARGDRKLADKASRRASEIYQSIVDLANKVCNKL